MVEQSECKNSPEPTQEPKKRRSRWAKVGRLKYNQQLLKRALAGIEEIRAMQRIILNGLKGAGYFRFDVPLIQKLSCVDAVDVEILESVRRAGNAGVYPSKIAVELNKLKPYGLSRFNISYRIVRMNKRLMAETGECLFEKRGQKWALTSFGFEVYGATSLEGVRGER